MSVQADIFKNWAAQFKLHVKSEKILSIPMRVKLCFANYDP